MKINFSNIGRKIQNERPIIMIIRYINKTFLLGLVVYFLCACSKVETKQEKFSEGDGVILAKNTYACKKPIEELDTVVTNNVALREEIENKIKKNTDCYAVDNFLVNGEWIILKIDGNKLLVKMNGYVGEYWTSSSLVAHSLFEQKKVTTSIIPAVSRENFDAKATKLDVNFTGNDPWEVLEAIKVLKTSQDKYENKINYKARIKNIENVNLFENVKFSGIFAFKINDNFHIDYNPDTENIIYTIYNYGGVIINKRNYDSNNWKNFFREQYGKLITEEEQIIVIDKLNNKKYSTYNGGAKINPIAAKKIEGKIVLFLVGRFVYPFLENSTHLPLEGERYDTVAKFKTEFQFLINEIWMVNNETGEILSKKFIGKS